MRIIIATGIYPPDIGGPAKYAKNLKREFLKLEHQVKVVAYTIEKKLPIGIRHCLYFLKLIFKLHKVKLIIALDTFSVAFPAVLAAKIFRKKIIIRVGGDFLWETYVEKTGDLITLEQFYAKKPKLPLKHKIIAPFQRFVLQHASALAFNSEWQKKLFEKVYKLDKQKTFVIENFYSKKNESVKPKQKNFLWAGREIKFKNLDLVSQAFKDLQKKNKQLKFEIVNNLLPQKLEQKIKGCYALIVPSISDFAPNFIIEGIKFNKPFILTKNCGLAEKLKDIGVFVDPFDREDVKNKILFLADEENYQKYQQKIANFNFVHSWGDIANKFLDIYKKL